MIIIEKIEDRYKTYSDAGLKIKPVFDRLNKPINPNAIYEEAIDVEIDGQPRYDYKETEKEIESIEK